MKRIFGILVFAVLVMGNQWAFAQYPYRYPYRPEDRYRALERNMERHQSNDTYHPRTTRGDNRLHLNLNYSISEPLGNLGQYISPLSFRGWNASILYQVSSRFAAGIGIGFQDYYEKFPRQVYTDKSTDISAVQTHSLQVIPVQATIQFLPVKNPGGVIPYLSLGVGAADVNYEKYWGEFADQRNRIAFSASPGIGALLPLGRKIKINVGVQYNYIAFKYDDIKGLHAVDGHVGLNIPLH